MTMNEKDRIRETLIGIEAVAAHLDEISEKKTEMAMKIRPEKDPMGFMAALGGAQYDKGYAAGLRNCVKHMLEILDDSEGDYDKDLLN